MNRISLISFISTLLLTLGSAGVHAKGGAKVEVCHQPPGNPSNYHTVRINEKALKAHLAHGDSAGSCDDVYPDQVNLQILGINDYHGHLESTTPGNIDGAPAGGSEYLSAKLNELREGQKYSLTVAAGDLIGGSPAFSGLFHDEPSVDSLNAMQLDISGVGNHEFDEGVTELLRMQNGGCHPVDGCYFPDAPYPGADFQWLAANVVNDAGETPLPPYWIERIRGVKVGFIGMTLEATDTLVAAAGIQGWNFLDEADTANALVPVLKAQGVEAIVVLLHEGGSQTPPPGDVDACVGISGPIVEINDALDPAIDVMITGHTHLPYNCKLPDADGNPRIVTSAYSFGRVVTEVNLVLDQKTGDVDRDLSTAMNHSVIQADLTPDPLLTAIIEKWQPLFDESGNTPVGTITEDILRGGNPPGSDRGVESAAGNLVADAQQWATSFNGAEIAFMNPGGVRSDLTYLQSGVEGDGVVTFGEAFTFQPFGNTLVTYQMTGAEIISVLEEQCQPLGSSRPVLHLGVSEGLTYDLRTTVVAGDCTAVTISNVQLEGVDLNPAGNYIVTVNSFLADGGDNFDTFGTITSPRLDGGNDLEALTNYLGTFGPVAPPSTDRVNELP
jgi:5'-nucleotidase